MSNIYIKEPPTSGKVLLETSVGDIDIELWCKECPKACRNFIQLCMEGYYNNTFFHRLVPNFLIQGGDPSGTGDGGESIYGKPFKDEFHQRLKFERRGLVGMASVEANSNSSQFFFTLDGAPELTNKNTLFGKVSGNTLYNMLALGETAIEEDGRPSKKQYIYKAEILNNPFDDLEPREHIIAALKNAAEKSKKESKPDSKKNKVQAVKNFALLSFGDEAEEEEDEIVSTTTASNQFKGSAHDLLHNDPKLIKSEQKTDVNKSSHDSTSRKHKVGTEKDSLCADEIEEAKKPPEAKKGKKSKGANQSGSSEGSDDESDDVSGDMRNVEADKRAKEKLVKLREESEKLKKDLNLNSTKQKNDNKEAKKKEQKVQENPDDMYSSSYMKKYRHLKTKSSKTPSEKAAKQDTTMKMLAEFEAKLNAANRLNLAAQYEDEEDENDSSELKKDTTELSEAVVINSSSSAWMTHTFQPDNDDLKQARDANVTRADEEYEIFDPRNPMNKRRRLNEAKRMKDRKRPLAGVKDLD